LVGGGDTDGLLYIDWPLIGRGQPGFFYYKFFGGKGGGGEGIIVVLRLGQ